MHCLAVMSPSVVFNSFDKILLILFSVIEEVVLNKIMKKKVRVTVLVSEKRSIYFAIELTLREMCYVLCARAHVHALKTRISCTVGMRNAKLRNHLKLA